MVNRIFVEKNYCSHLLGLHLRTPWFEMVKYICQIWDYLADYFLYHLIHSFSSKLFSVEYFCSLYQSYHHSCFRGVCSNTAPYCVLMEFCPFGQLYDALRNGKEVPPCLLIDWARQIADGMAYLHQRKIIHRDLKSPK